MKKGLFFLIFLSIRTFSQDTLPVTIYKGLDSTKPLIFYVSGDGGLTNYFSSSLMKKFNKNGYPIIGLDSKIYFWKKKKPKQAAADISKILLQYMNEWNCKTFVFIGFSFGADVTPFVQTRLSKNLFDGCKHTVLISPSKKTDFEIHILDMLGWGSGSGEDVAEEISKLKGPITIIYGSDENNSPAKKIKSKNVETIKLPGGHHYEGNVDEVVNQIIDKIK